MAEDKQTIMGCSFAQTSYGWKEIKIITLYGYEKDSKYKESK